MKQSRTSRKFCGEGRQRGILDQGKAVHVKRENSKYCKQVLRTTEFANLLVGLGKTGGRLRGSPGGGSEGTEERVSS
jgi:hypothetical protein